MRIHLGSPSVTLISAFVASCLFCGCGESTDVVVAESAAPVALEPIDFNRDIRPILSENCYFCHGPDEENNKSELRLDIREKAVASGALIPGDSASSEVIWRIMSDNPEEVMPTPESHKTLSDAEKELLARWVDEGAEYDAHWSYKRVERPDLESIDAAVAKELQARELEFSGAADKATLVRRVYFDITGLPPTAEQARAFVEDDSPEAYENLVDALLASPHYGENMAIYWLDAVRYADTVGYHGDQNRDASPYRDYVIHAFNENLPYDQFTIDQLAGDLLTEPKLEQLVASSYNRLNQLSAEGGVQDKEYIKKYQSERVRTTSTAWLGSTLACAECHDHKFDPFTAKDFYSFAAFFADILEKGAWNGKGAYQVDGNAFKAYITENYTLNPGNNRDFGPLVTVPNRTFIQNMDAHEPELEQLRANLYTGTSAAHAEFDRWLAREKRFHELEIQPEYQYHLEGEGSIQAPVELNLLGEAVKTLKLKVGYNSEVESKGAAFAARLNFDSGSLLVTWGNEIQQDGIKVIRQKRPNKLKAVNDVTLKVADLKLETAAKTLESIEFLTSSDARGVQAFDLRKVEVETHHYQVPKGKLSDASIVVLNQYFEDSSADVVALRQVFFTDHAKSSDLQQAQQEYNELYDFMNGSRTTPATISATPREVRVLPRGNWMDETGEVVLPATPSFLPDLRESTESQRLSRLDLAHWMVSRENPLTARTYINRLWAQFFGTALSSAPEDLGLQGEYPIYPELLEWLSVEFMESGWDIKHMVKQIVMSRTYQQSSVVTPELQELDPYNRLLARQSPRRLPAEGIRDNALAISGLLVRQVGGRSVKPYQPAGYYQHLNFPARKYVAETNQEQYRRGVYMHWQRTFLHPMLMAFDAPGRDECTVARSQSNTPLQALNLLNDPTFLEAAKALADKVLSAESSSDVARLEVAFERVLLRKPSAQEMSLLQDFLARERARFAEDPSASEDFLKVGVYAVNSATPETEVAAWMSVSRALLNLNETITRY